MSLAAPLVASYQYAGRGGGIDFARGFLVLKCFKLQKLFV